MIPSAELQWMKDQRRTVAGKILDMRSTLRNGGLPLAKYNELIRKAIGTIPMKPTPKNLLEEAFANIRYARTPLPRNPYDSEYYSA